jgi:antimicrobial peptide system SdpB family protein
MLIAIAEKIRARLPRTDPWTNVYGLARTLLALSLAITLGFNDLSDLFMPRGNGGVIGFECNLALSKAGLFCLAEEANAQLARGFALLVLLVTASGWRPRITGPLHWYVAFSFQANANVVDGGDQLGAILALLLLPITLLDGRKWHWDLPVGAHDERRRLVGWWFFMLVRIQVAIVYFHAAVGKFEVTEWTDGTALYYWLLHPTFGVSDWLRPAILPVLLHGTLVALLTWSVLALEFMLAAGLIAAPQWRRSLLFGGFLLHAGIIVVHGLVSFSMVMFAALILFLHPVDVPLARWLPRAQPPRARAQSSM